MNEQDYKNLLESGYTRAELCWIVLSCLDIICKNKQNYLFYTCSYFGCNKPASFYIADKGYCLIHYNQIKEVKPNETK